MFDEFLMRIRDFEARIVALHTPLRPRWVGNFPKQEEPVAYAWVQEYMDGVGGDFTVEMPGSKAKTELVPLQALVLG